MKSSPEKGLRIHASKSGRLYIDPSDLFANAKLFNTIENAKGYEHIKDEIEVNVAAQDEQRHPRVPDTSSQ